MNARSEEYHVPVLLKEAVEGLDIQPGGIYADLTFGGGGHSAEILRRLQGTGHLYAFDQDQDVLPRAHELEAHGNFTFVRSNFRFLTEWMRYYGQPQLDGILADLGVSSHHFDQQDRGFSFRFDAPLDMRMNQSARLDARRILADYSEEALADILYLYGELRNSRRIAASIVRARQQQPVLTTGQLADIVAPLMPYDREKKDLARVFQALRIEVNGEMTALRQMLAAATQLLRPGGRLSILTYHSLEDRMVKNIIRAGNPEGKAQADIFGHTDAPLQPVNRAVITPSPEEQDSNPRSRSAKLRIAQKRQPGK